MIIIGVVLVIVAAVFGLDLLWKNSYSITSPTVFGQSLGIHNAGVLFLVGVITGAVLILGIALILAGLRRKGSKAVEHRRERKRANKTADARDGLAADNAALRQELDDQRQELDDRNTPPPAAAPVIVQAPPAVNPPTVEQPPVGRQETFDSAVGPGATRADLPPAGRYDESGQQDIPPAKPSR